MGGPRGYYVSEVSQTNTLCFTDMWDLKNKIKKQNRNRLRDMDNRLIIASGERGEGDGLKR